MTSSRFEFKPLSAPVQWKAVLATDADRIQATNDVHTLMQRFQDVSIGDARNPGYYADAGLLKALQLGQLATQYLSYSQKFLNNKINQLEATVAECALALEDVKREQSGKDELLKRMRKDAKAYGAQIESFRLLLTARDPELASRVEVHKGELKSTMLNTGMGARSSRSKTRKSTFKAPRRPLPEDIGDYDEYPTVQAVPVPLTRRETGPVKVIMRDESPELPPKTTSSVASQPKPFDLRGHLKLGASSEFKLLTVSACSLPLSHQPSSGSGSESGSQSESEGGDGGGTLRSHKQLPGSATLTSQRKPIFRVTRDLLLLFKLLVVTSPTLLKPGTDCVTLRIQVLNATSKQLCPVWTSRDITITATNPKAVLTDEFVVSKELFQGSDAGDATVRVEMLCDGTVCCAADLALAHVYSSLFSSPTTLLTPHTDDAAALLSFE